MVLKEYPEAKVCSRTTSFGGARNFPRSLVLSVPNTVGYPVQTCCCLLLHFLPSDAESLPSASIRGRWSQPQIRASALCCPGEIRKTIGVAQTVQRSWESQGQSFSVRYPCIRFWLASWPQAFHFVWPDWSSCLLTAPVKGSVNAISLSLDFTSR